MQVVETCYYHDSEFPIPLILFGDIKTEKEYDVKTLVSIRDLEVAIGKEMSVRLGQYLRSSHKVGRVKCRVMRVNRTATVYGYVYDSLVKEMVRLSYMPHYAEAYRAFTASIHELEKKEMI